MTISCTLSSNGYAVSLKALVDSGANGFVFINTPLAISIATFLNVKAQRLPKPIPVKGYNGQSGDAITHILRLHLTVDGRRQYHLPLMILDLGSHDLILGRKWLAHFDILVNARRGCLQWPQQYPPSYSVIKECIVSQDVLAPDMIQQEHQDDVEARDRAFELEDKRRAAGRASRQQATPVEVSVFEPAHDSGYDSSSDTELTGKDESDTESTDRNEAIDSQSAERPYSRQSVANSTHKWDMVDNLRKMNAQLAGRPRVTLAPYKKKPFPKPKDKPKPVVVDIAAISAVCTHFNLKRKENEAFTTSLYEIDRILEDRYMQSEGYIRWAQQINDLQEAAQRLTGNTVCEVDVANEEIDEWEKVPECFREFKAAFSKQASDTLPPHRPYDHKIELVKDVDLGFSPLYKMTTEELETVKEYLVDNLHKGFIEPSQAPFAAPVLFVKKPNGGLRFCIDFRKLNQITRKDQYPIPLIDELLARIGRAKIFTKLDIRQAFHRIRIDPASEELTTFRTRYGSYKCKVLPFGLTNGPATYQRYMNDMLLDYLDDFCTVYLDDILIYSDNELEHELHVKKVLQRLIDAGLQADIKKCEFGVTKTKFLGFIVSTDGIEVDPAKVSVIQDWKAPDTVRGI
jgi:predicted aspartyl protease